MERIVFEEIKRWVDLALQQDDSKIVDKILKAFKKRLRDIELDDNEIRSKVVELLNADSSNKKVAAFVSLSDLLDEKLKKPTAPKVTTFFSDKITICASALEKLEQAVSESERAKDKIRFVLENLTDPAYQKGKLVKLTYPLGDLMDFKDGSRGTMTIRILYFLDKNILRICDFYISHIIYERALQKQIHFKKNYEKERWLLIPRF